MSEVTDIHQPFMRWLDSRGVLYRRSRSDRETSEHPGEPDFLLLRAGHVLPIEMKTTKGLLSFRQKERHQQYLGAGCRVIVCRDLATACAVTEAWLTSLPVTDADAPPLAETSSRLVIRSIRGRGDYVYNGKTPLRRAVVADYATLQRA